MPRYRSRLVPIAQQDKDANEALRNLTDNGITAIRRRRGGEITAVKHVTYGWISAKEYGEHRILKQSVPVLIEIVKGGYMMKAAIWTVALPVEIIGSGTGIPVGFLIITVALALYEVDVANGKQAEAWMDLAALILPFGEIWLLVRGAAWFATLFSTVADWPGWASDVENALKGISNYLSSGAKTLPDALSGLLGTAGLLGIPTAVGQVTG